MYMYILCTCRYYCKRLKLNEFHLHNTKKNISFQVDAVGPTVELPKIIGSLRFQFFAPVLSFSAPAKLLRPVSSTLGRPWANLRVRHDGSSICLDKKRKKCVKQPYDWCVLGLQHTGEWSFGVYLNSHKKGRNHRRPISLPRSHVFQSKKFAGRWLNHSTNIPGFIVGDSHLSHEVRSLLVWGGSRPYIRYTFLFIFNQSVEKRPKVLMKHFPERKNQLEFETHISMLLQSRFH